MAKTDEVLSLTDIFKEVTKKYVIYDLMTDLV